MFAIIHLLATFIADSRSGTDPPVTVHVRLAPAVSPVLGGGTGLRFVQGVRAGMEHSGNDGRAGEVSLAAPGDDGRPVRSRPPAALAVWSNVLQAGPLS